MNIKKNNPRISKSILMILALLFFFKNNSFVLAKLHNELHRDNKNGIFKKRFKLPIMLEVFSVLAIIAAGAVVLAKSDETLDTTGEDKIRGSHLDSKKTSDTTGEDKIEGSHLDSEEKCPICKNVFKAGMKIIETRCCKIRFCKKCVNDWTKKKIEAEMNPTCPGCNRNLTLKRIASKS
ncbi:MAG: hypothetical protein LBK29_04700 [Oscillospiraceae bacterium]|nr:hypothetical protein [Oscillospiraceae bacterium]